MKKLIICIFIILSIMSCSNIINQDEKIIPSQYNFFVDTTSDISTCHFFVQNVSNRNKNFGLNLFENKNFMLDLFPGKYNFYFYDLIYKTDTTKKVYSYSAIKDVFVEIGKKRTIVINPIILQPNLSIKNENSYYTVLVNLNDIYEMFSVSSISIKQGTDKYRSINCYANEKDSNYCGEVPFFQSGSWYANISFAIKSKNDETVLSQDNLNISTSNFSNIYLGDF